MASLKEIRNRIKSVSGTQQITKAMKMVAAAKLRKSQDRIIQMRPYAKKLNSVMARVSANYTGDFQNPYAEVRPEGKVLVVLVTSDRGLCGAFNTNVIKMVYSFMEEKHPDAWKQGKFEVLTMGKRGTEAMQRRKFSVIDSFAKTMENPVFDNVALVSDYIMNQWQTGAWSHVYLVYNEFKNVATQIVRAESYLPIKAETGGNTEGGLDYIFEPSPEYILNDLVPKSLNIRLFSAVLESAASENGARMTAMDKATENAGELLKELKLTYNSTRQAAITKEILEIVGGAEALAESNG